MAEKRQRRRLDTRPQNRPDVKAGVTKAHLDMQGNLIGGTLATGEKVGTKEGTEPGGGEGLSIGRKDMSLEGFYQRNPRLKRTGTNAEKFDPAAASGRKTVKRRLKATRESREYLAKEAEATKKAAADHAAKVFAPDPFNPGEQVEIKPAAPGAPAPAPAPGGGGAGKGLDVGKVQGAKGGLGKKDPAEKAPAPQQPAQQPAAQPAPAPAAQPPPVAR